MDNQNKYDALVSHTNYVARVWKKVRGFAPDSVADKLDIAMLDWQSELTNTLKIWIDKGYTMTTGELILARVNIGAVVESWLKFFYCVYYEDYCKIPIENKAKKMQEPEKVTLEQLKVFSSGILWDDETSTEYAWVDSVQHKRNAIHSFNYRDIGTKHEFLDDINHLYDFVDNILTRLPPIEDFIGDHLWDYVVDPYY